MNELTDDRSGETGTDSLDAAFSALAHGGRRRVLQRLLKAAPDPVPRGGLAPAFAACTHEKSSEEVTEEDCQNAAIALHHRHLPTMTAAGLVEYDTDDNTVTLVETPSLRDPYILEAVEGSAPASPESLDAVFDALADDRRRTILDVLSHQIGRIHVETLARELGARERGVAESDISEASVEEVLTRLRHVDLPHLAEAGLVRHDPEARTVAYAGHPALRVPWMHSALHHEFRQRLTGEAEPDGIGELEGRERVVSFGQSVIESAEEELFCMFTDTGLLKTGCLARVRDAARERDVDVYLGTRDPAVKEYVEENAPEVVVWNPDTGWLNLPAEGDRIGRLLMADRETVMLGTLTEEQSDGLYEEQAMIGDGEHNTLVTMVRQLVAPHLEAVSGDVEDVEGGIRL
ncbi:hypothetical protein [Halorubrum sp. CSM-61]|uniref:DUF7344 domain-containing protein n=1 Tax=Halorubrum sp. CSM-61 TaxID=2485838 RepID=UPI000F4C4CE2|nr:hypothetical protein [Halorubrum sp. CSM-61]